MPKYGPRKSGKERFAHEVMEEIEHKQNVLARALGVQTEEVEGVRSARMQAKLRQLDTGRPPYEPSTTLEVEVEQTVKRGRDLLRSVIATPGRGR